MPSPSPTRPDMMVNTSLRTKSTARSMRWGRTALKATISIGLTIAVFYLVFSRADVPSLKSFLTGFPAQIFFAVIALSIAATALAVWRLKLIAQDLGYRLSIRDAVAALSLGLLAGTMFFQLIGQLMARS